ncbi:signal peptidase I [Stutzerimonas kirkiae]|uniref:Signal peptidase I n=1 Tax=Stutzerimonas kirkiae TaxID=2211392 RepID=A0A4Q9R1K1_9GAMM|nr:signal peptidase I [Stutzerimonas kirkiae]TBU92858.1 signal peptidase I [Stutzerimonas kirkiae]TBV01321.1 signal peptidase I [Stutzerimonas kirkiae]TBV10786.1 signal peptidase I [Stutzerimonas kirkiae]TBV14573.1 signal peptidase I [Stutzerimonas kirkiae]
MSINFPLLLVLAVAICGALALADLLFFAPRRRSAIARYESGATGEADPQVLEKLNKEPLLIEYGKSFFPVLAIVLVLRSFLVEPFQIPSGSMIPTLEVGDFILVNKFAYGIRLPVADTKVIEVSDPKRGDVMVFRYPSDPNINYIKRVVGLPGDVVRYTSDKRLYVNDQLVAQTLVGEEPGSLGSAMLYQERLGEAEHLIRKEMSRYRVEAERQWAVPAGHYFMMGDNRDNSNDSRYWQSVSGEPEMAGMVPDRNIVGKAFAVWMSWGEPKLSSLPSFSRVGLIH